MAKDSKIGWTHHTFNPLWGCMKVSEGCANCYALTFSKRVGYDIWGPASTTKRRTFGAKHWAEPLAWDAAAAKDGERRRVFCASMADVFEEHPQWPAERLKLWALIERTPNLDWLLLTKRPENIMDMVPTPWRDSFPRNVWMGTSVEHQKAAHARIGYLDEVPAVVRFLSCEPLLEPVHLDPWRRMFEWVIVGGESGAGHRPMQPEWVRVIREFCAAAGVPLYFKQGSGLYPGKGRELDGRTWDEFPTARALVTA